MRSELSSKPKLNCSLAGQTPLGSEMGAWCLLLSLYILLLTSSSSIAISRNLSPSLAQDDGRSRLAALGPPTYYTHYEHQFVDHFNFVDQRGFQQKALVTGNGDARNLLWCGRSSIDCLMSHTNLGLVQSHNCPVLVHSVFKDLSVQ